MQKSTCGWCSEVLYYAFPEWTRLDISILGPRKSDSPDGKKSRKIELTQDSSPEDGYRGEKINFLELGSRDLSKASMTFTREDIALEKGLEMA